MTDATSIGLATAFVAGLVSFLSPCVLPLVPGYVSFIAGQSAQRVHARLAARLATLGTSAFFVAGFSTVFIAFGASASALGQLVARYRYEANIAGGIVIVLFGLLMLGMLRRVPWLQRDLRFHPVWSAVTRSPPTRSASRSASAGRPASARCSARSSR